MTINVCFVYGPVSFFIIFVMVCDYWIFHKKLHKQQNVLN